ncbi:S8 family serine peptidase, partial [Candidatus Pacearchaeota archaeon]|nr:S8 family serine peptidase [Candidatus Pacearchaeota archaeon]
MKKEAIFLIIVVLAGSFFFAEWTEQTDTNMTGYAVSDTGVRVEKSIVEKVEKNESVRVNIQLKKNGDSIKNVEKALEGKIKHRFEKKGEVSAVISKKELENLENNSEVEIIDPVGIRSIALDDSVPLVNASSIWAIQSNEVNLTGKGETICIIDTGIDLDHPDLGGCFGENNPDSSCKILGGIDYCADDTTCTSTDSNPNDAHGHGSHVAGIAAANGSLDGVAPGAKLIIIKAANSTGTFWDDDLAKAIEWCTNNASTFNISVISMSLGGGLYSSYCNSDPLADEINAAVANNISVVVASGNDGSTSQINGPACVENATPVGGSTKSDGMYSNGNRNSIVQLIAPGVNINSTIPNNAYSTLTGTSMSTPHVSGAVAILNQFLRLEKGMDYTPSQIEDVFNDTGERIDDSGGSGEIFSRINVYGAVSSLDNEINNITLLSPSHNSNNGSGNVSFSCYAQDIFGLENVTFNLWNSSGEVVNETVESASGNSTYTMNLNISNLDNGSYTWNCMAVDSLGNSNWSSSNFTRIVGIMESALTSPSNNTYKNTASEENFTCSGNDSVADFANVTFYLWNSSSLIYNTTESITGSSNSSIFNYTISNEDNYEWNCYFRDSDGNLINTDNYTITYDATAPSITLIDPDEGETTSSTEIDFQYNVVDDNLKNCSLLFDGVINQTDTSVTSGTNQFENADVETGNFEWQIRCYDYAGNTAISSEWDLSISTSSSDDDDDDDSSSSDDSDDDDDDSTEIIPTETTTPVIYNLGESSLERGSNKALVANSKLNFKINNEDHSVTIDSVYSSSAKITIQSDPKTIILKEGESEKFELTGDKIYDLLVELHNIIEATSKANITVTSISEEIGTRQVSDDKSENNSGDTVGSGNATENDSGEGISEKTKMIIIVSLLGAVALAGLG